MIQTASCSLNELFLGFISAPALKGTLAVPSYQRPYLWGREEVDRMVNSLFSYAADTSADKPDLYLGSIILHQEGDLWNIIDGQQRITTLGLILAAMNLTQAIPQIVYTSPVTLQNIAYNFRYIKDNYPELERFSDWILSRINITLVITTREDDAYTFFETMNTGGVRLTGVDIIKAHHLRSVPVALRDNYAINWEKHKHLNAAARLILKSRWWSVLNWQQTPRRRDYRALKAAIVKEFSERTMAATAMNIGYALARINQQQIGQKLTIDGLPFAIRQPIGDGCNFIDFMLSFTALYDVVLPYSAQPAQTNSYPDFINRIIKPEDGTLFLKEVFEVCMLCYAHRFGTARLYEAALWIFRQVYALRLSQPKFVREDSVTNMLKDQKLPDVILAAFSHEQLITELGWFRYQVNTDNINDTSVKGRYLGRLQDFFGPSINGEPGTDARLKAAITQLYDK